MLQVRPDFSTPTLDGLFVSLDGTLDRYLGRPAQLLEQTADVILMVMDTELLLDAQKGLWFPYPYSTPTLGKLTFSAQRSVKGS